MQVSVELPQDLIRFIDSKQLNFATARALTWTAQDAQREIRRQLPRRFIIRNNFVSRGIQFDRASKYRLESEVGASNSIGKTGRGLDFMARQETGGTKRPTASKHVAVPVNARRSKRQIITKAQRPRAVLTKANTFKLDEQRGKLRPGVYQRTGPGSLSLLYSLKPTTQVEERFGLRPTVEGVVGNRWPRLFKLSLDDALRTAR